MPSVFDYLDYRTFLRDFYTEKKRQMAYFSYRLIGRSVGMDSSHLIRVIQGAQHISTKKIPAFARVCKFSLQEEHYFEALVNFNKAKSEAQRSAYLDKLFKATRVHSQRLEPFQYEFFRKWYYSAIWALVQLKPRPADYQHLARLCDPPISTSEAREAVELLLRLGLAEQSEQGTITVTARHVTTGEKWASDAIAGYQREMLRRADAVLGKGPRTNRDISTLTFTIRQDALDQVREMAAEFRRSITALTNEQVDPDRAYQLNIQIFPITRRDSHDAT